MFSKQHNTGEFYLMFLNWKHKIVSFACHQNHEDFLMAVLLLNHSVTEPRGFVTVSQKVREGGKTQPQFLFVWREEKNQKEKW